MKLLAHLFLFIFVTSALGATAYNVTCPECDKDQVLAPKSKDAASAWEDGGTVQNLRLTFKCKKCGHEFVTWIDRKVKTPVPVALPATVLVANAVKYSGQYKEEPPAPPYPPDVLPANRPRKARFFATTNILAGGATTNILPGRGITIITGSWPNTIVVTNYLRQPSKQWKVYPGSTIKLSPSRKVRGFAPASVGTFTLDQLYNREDNVVTLGMDIDGIHWSWIEETFELGPTAYWRPIIVFDPAFWPESYVTYGFSPNPGCYSWRAVRADGPP